MLTASASIPKILNLIPVRLVPTIEVDPLLSIALSHAFW
jgi:hypothetical protein